MNMTVAELIELLEGADPEAEVRMAIQPSWPLQFEIKSVEESDAGVVYITQGEHPQDSPYAPEGVI